MSPEDDINALSIIPGVGRSRARALIAAGYLTVKDVADAKADELAKVKGISPTLAVKVKKGAMAIAKGTPQDGVSDGHWYRESNNLFLCPACGSLVASGSEKCPRCDAVFEEEDSVEVPLAPAEAEKPKTEHDGFWYKERANLFLCPECGSLVAHGTKNCPKCKVEFAPEESVEVPLPEVQAEAAKREEDGYWYRQQAKLFLCPSCGSLATAGSKNCPNCGVEFEEDESVEMPLEQPETKKPKTEQDGFWYKDRANLFLCPSCGSLVASGSEKCPNCETNFEKDDSVELPLVKTDDEKVAEAKDGFWYKDQKDLFLCPSCGSLATAGTKNCPNCGVEFLEEEAVEIPLEEKKEEPVVEEAPVEIFLCPDCGALISSNAAKCLNCGTSFVEEKPAESGTLKPEGNAKRCHTCNVEFEGDGKLCKRCAALEKVRTLGYGLELIPETPVEQNAVEPVEQAVLEPEAIIAEEAVKAEAAAAEDVAEKLVSEAKAEERGDLEVHVCETCGKELKKGETVCLDCRIKRLTSRLGGFKEPQPERELPKKRGISKDFIQRWSGMGAGALALEAQKAREAEKAKAKEVEKAEEELPELTPHAKPEQRPKEPPRPIKEPKTPEDWFQRGMELMADEKMDDAMACFDKAAELAPEKEMDYRARALDAMSKIRGDLGDEMAIEKDMENDEARLWFIEEGLKNNPKDDRLWQEKGEILQRRGRSQEAMKCFSEAIKCSYERIEELDDSLKPVPEPERKTKSLSKPGGLTNGALAPKTGGLTNGSLAGRTNGLVNGRGRTNGMTNGRGGKTNGLTNGRGRINGIRGKTNGAGKTNGLVNGMGKVNGLVNGRGRVNGLTNGRGRSGRTNGLVNGKGQTNGRINGLVNGRGRTNGLINGMGSGGLTNGMGLVNGSGLVNGVGLINGTGLINGSGVARPTKTRASSQNQWRTFTVIMIAFVAIAMLAPMFGVVQQQAGVAVSVDGVFSDWEGVPAYTESAIQKNVVSDIALDTVKVHYEAPKLFVYVAVKGEALAGRFATGMNTTAIAYAFIDSDRSAATGYSVGGIGADHLLQLYGWRGIKEGCVLRTFDGARAQTDWNGFDSGASANAAVSLSEIEAEAILPNNASAPMVLVATTDGSGMFDVSESPVTSGLVAVRAFSNGPELQSLPVPGNDILQNITLHSSGGNSTVTGLVFQRVGESPSAALVNSVAIERRGGTVVSVFTQSSSGNLIFVNLTEPLELADDEKVSVRMSGDVGFGATLPTTTGIELKNILINGAGDIRIDKRASPIVSVGPWSEVRVDGSFADWSSVVKQGDVSGDVNGTTANGLVENTNVDLLASALLDSGAFYAEVAGSMLGGSAFPTYAVRGQPPRPADWNHSDDDTDGVPNALDPMPYDFNNDGVNDTASHGDKDSDGATDYPYGPDYWLNTTIPAGFPSNYSNKTVSRYIGPVSHVPDIGEDSLILWIDSDANPAAGASITAAMGADYSLLIKGMDGAATEVALSIFNPLAGNMPWTELPDVVNVATDMSKLEGALPSWLMSNMTRILIELRDWNNAWDRGGASLAPSPFLTGTRSPAGDNVVINELVSQPNNGEWIELCNPTAAAINIGGWRLRQGTNTIAIIPFGTNIGAFGSGTEYYVVDLSSAANDLPNAGAVVTLQRLVGFTWTTQDSTTYGTIPAGQSWARYKNATYGMPTDTDNDANDFYVSTAPTRRAPNDYRRPAMTLDKLGDRATANAGDQVVYTIWYNNTGDGSARYVWVNDTLPAGMTYVTSSVPYTSAAGNVYTWLFLAVTPGSHPFTVTAQVNAGVPGGTSLVNLARLQYTDQLRRAMGTLSHWWNVTVLDNVRPTVISTAPINGATNVAVGQSIVITFSEPMNPATFTYSLAPNPGGLAVAWSAGNTVATITHAAFAGNTPYTFTITGANDAAGNPISPIPYSFSYTTLAAPAITVDKIADTDGAAPGDQILYTIYYNNTGAGNAGAAWINDTLPAGVTFVSADPVQTSSAGLTYRWIFANLPAGAHEIDVTVRVNATTAAGTILRNRVGLNYTNLLGVKLAASADMFPVTVVAAYTRIVINEISSVGTEWIELANPTSTAVNIGGWRIRRGAATIYTFPANTILGAWGSGTEYLSVGLVGALPNGGGTVRLQRPGPWTTIDQTTYPALTSTRSWSRFKDEDTGKPVDTDNNANDFYISNNGWILPEGPTRNGPNDRRRPVMAVQKKAPQITAEPGETINYTLWYNNTGDGNARQIWLNDTMPAGTTFVSSSVAPYSQSGNLITWYLNKINHNTVNSLTLRLRVDSSAADGTVLVNQASLTYRDQLLRPMGTSRSWWNITVRRPSITVVKTANLRTVQAGGTLIYTITYNNVGSRNAGHVWINDTLPSWVTYQSANPMPSGIIGNTLMWHFTNVAPGARSITVTVVVSPSAPTGTNIVNTATLNYTTMNNRPLPGSNSTVTVVVPEYSTIVVPILPCIIIGWIAVRTVKKKKND